jgi:hypothetical protein
MPLPQRTLADQLISADAVAFGREAPHVPFSYTAVRVLKGKLPDHHVGLFADSTTRRQLNADEKRVVVLVRSKDEWKNLGVADEEYQQIVKRILVFASEWKGDDGRQKRLEYFLSLWGHENRTIRELAYLELGKAPYSSIKQFAKSISEEELQPLLTDRNYLEWRSLAILILAQRDDENSRKLISKSFGNCAQFSLTTNLAAWATAYLEVHGSNGVDVVEREYLKNKDRSDKEIRAILTALSIHGQQDNAALRERIVTSYGSALENHPLTAGLIARDLTDWKEWRYRKEIASTLLMLRPASKFQKTQVATMRTYLSLAK